MGRVITTSQELVTVNVNAMVLLYCFRRVCVGGLCLLVACLIHGYGFISHEAKILIIFYSWARSKHEKYYVEPVNV